MSTVGIRALKQNASAVVAEAAAGDIVFTKLPDSRLSDPEYLRLLVREALNDTGDEIVEEASRRAYYQEHSRAIASHQGDGDLSDKYDPAYLNLAMTALTLFPHGRVRSDSGLTRACDH